MFLGTTHLLRLLAFICVEKVRSKMELNNFSFSAENVDAAIKYLKGKGKDQPSFLKKKQFKVKDGSLYVQDRMVIPDEQRDTFLRELCTVTRNFRLVATAFSIWRARHS